MYKTMNLFNTYPEREQQDLSKLHTVYMQASLRSSNFLERSCHARWVRFRLFDFLLRPGDFVRPFFITEFCWGSPIGRGVWLRPRLLRVRISPSVPLSTKLLDYWRFSTKDRIVWCGLSLIGKALECGSSHLIMGLGALGVSIPIGHPKRFCKRFTLR